MTDEQNRRKYENISYKQQFLGSTALGFGHRAFGKNVIKTVKFRGMAIPVAGIKITKLSAPFMAAGVGLSIASTVNQVRAAQHSKHPISNFLKTTFLGGIAGRLGGTLGMKSASVLVKTTAKGLYAAKASPLAQKAMEARRFAKAKPLNADVVMPKQSVVQKGKMIFRRIRGRIVPIRATSPYGGRLAGKS